MAQIKTGTVSVTNGSNVVTGVGTTWLTDGVQAGDGFVIATSSGIDGAGVYYTVGGSVTETGLQLSSNWAGATGSGLAYAIVPDFIAPGYPQLLPGDLEVKPLINQNVQKILNEKAPALVSTASGASQTVAGALDDRVVVAKTTLTFNIPTDYESLQVAVDQLSWKYRPGQGVIVDLVFETGHQPSAGLLIENGDYSHFRISAIDAETFLNATFPATDIIKGVRAQMPVLNCLINANGRGLTGYFADEGSTGKVNSGCGVKDAQQHGLYANAGSTVNARSSDFTGASKEGPVYTGILAWGSLIDAQSADVSGSGWYGAQAAAAGVLNFRLGNADNAFRYGIRATNGSKANARDASAQNCTEKGIVAQEGSEVEARGANVANSVIGFDAQYNGRISADNSTAQNCTTAACRAFFNSSIDFSGELGNANASGSAIAFDARHNSTISAPEAIALNCTTVVCKANFQSHINFRDGDGTGSVSLIEAVEGSSVNATNALAPGCTSRAVSVTGNSKATIASADITNCLEPTEVVRVLYNSEVSMRVAKVGGATGATVINCEELSKVDAYFLDLTGGISGLIGEVDRGSQILVSSGALADFNVAAFNAIDAAKGIVWKP